MTPEDASRALAIFYKHKGAEWVGVGGWTSQSWDASLGGKPVAVTRKRCTGCGLLVKSLSSHWDDLLDEEGIRIG